MIEPPRPSETVRAHGRSLPQDPRAIRGTLEERAKQLPPVRAEYLPISRQNVREIPDLRPPNPAGGPSESSGLDRCLGSQQPVVVREPEAPVQRLSQRSRIESDAAGVADRLERSLHQSRANPGSPLFRIH